MTCCWVTAQRQLERWLHRKQITAVLLPQQPLWPPALVAVQPQQHSRQVVPPQQPLTTQHQSLLSHVTGALSSRFLQSLGRLYWGNLQPIRQRPTMGTNHLTSEECPVHGARARRGGGGGGVWKHRRNM